MRTLRYAIIIAQLFIGNRLLAQGVPNTNVNHESSSPIQMAYAVGDKLKISFYEQLKTSDEGKWVDLGKPRIAGPSFYLHTELSGEYVVQSDWTVSVPVIGNIVAVHRSSQQLQTELEKGFEKLTGHMGFVSVGIVERRPLYVIGQVKQPGSYKYESGMTPLALIALAGGTLRSQDDRWAVVEAVREAGKERALIDRLSGQLAELAALKAELGGKPVELPSQLVELCGRQRAQELLAAEQARRGPVIQAHGARLAALQAAVDAEQHALNIDNDRLPTMNDNVNVRRSRLAALQDLAMRRDVHNVILEQAQGELSDVSDRRASVLAAIQDDERKLALARLDATRFLIETKVELGQEIAAHQREIDELTPGAAAGAGILGLLKPDAASGPDFTHFEIVRGSGVLLAGITTALEPGDVLRVASGKPVLANETAEEGDGRGQFSQAN